MSPFGREIGRDDLYHMIQRIGDRARVAKADIEYPPRKRGTVWFPTSPPLESWLFL